MSTFLSILQAVATVVGHGIVVIALVGGSLIAYLEWAYPPCRVCATKAARRGRLCPLCRDRAITRHPAGQGRDWAAWEQEVTR